MIKRIYSRAAQAARSFKNRLRRFYVEVSRSAIGFGGGLKRIESCTGWSGPNKPAPLMAEIAYNKYGAYCVPLSSRHRPAAQRVLQYDVYEPDTIEFIETHCGQGDVVHAGTFFGDFLPALSDAVSANAVVWAFEPNRESFRCAEITVLLNGLSNVRLCNAGLGARASVEILYTADATGRALGGGSRFMAADNLGGSGYEVELVAIDEVLPSDRVISVLQLDVEDYEQPALAGALQTIKRCHPILILEELPGSRLLASDFFSSEILSLGYREIGRVSGNAVFAT